MTPSATRPRARRRRVPRVPESDLRRLISDWLTIAGVPHSITDAALVVVDGKARRSRVRKSWPDITACCPVSGRFIAIEIKTPDGVWQPGQEELLDHLKSCGAWCVVPRTAGELVDWFAWKYFGDDVACDSWPTRELAERMLCVERAIRAFRAGAGTQ